MRPYDFEIRTEFPNARLFKAWEGGGAFKAERDGKPFVTTDGRTIAEFLDEAALEPKAIEAPEGVERPARDGPLDEIHRDRLHESPRSNTPDDIAHMAVPRV